MDAWRLGVKAVAIYRDNCKVGQPLSTAKKDGDESSSSVTATDSVAAELFTRIELLEAALEVAKSEGQHVVVGALRERMPRRRVSTTFAFRVADCEGYVTVGEYEDGRPGEVFIKVSKPVSYTHLDVYKRQASGDASSRAKSLLRSDLRRPR